jgi:hypothetical protein
VRATIKDTLGYEAPERSHIPFKRWRRDTQWLQTAPPESIARIKRRVQAEDVALDDRLTLAPIIEEEMQRLVTP